MKTLTLYFLVTVCTASIINSQWIRTNGPEGGSITSIYTDSQTSYAGSGEGDMYFSFDFGETWSIRNNGLPPNHSINCITSQNNIIYTGTSGIYYSSNSGLSWINMNLDANVLSIGFSGDMLITGVWYGGIYTTTNNGQNWIHSISGLPTSNYVYALIVSGSTILIGTGGGIYASTNNCTSWYNSSSGLPHSQVISLVKKGNTIFAASASSGVYSSTDNGANWIFKGQGLPEFISVNSLSIINNDLVTTIYEKGIYKSTNDGLNWLPINQGIHEYMNISYVAGYGNTYLAGSWNEGIIKSTNSGSTWNYSNSGIASTNIITLYNHDNKVYCGTQQNGIHSTTNYGLTWMHLSSFSTHILQVGAITESGPNLLAGTSGYFGGIYLSSNNGANWSAVYTDTSITAVSIKSFAVIGNNTFAATNKGVLKSTDYGWSWNFINTVYPNSNVNVLAANGNDLFAASNGLYRSSDAGISWVSLGLSSYEIHSLAILNNIIFAGTFGMGIRRSTNYGTTWQLSGLTNGYIINAICVYTNYVFAATGGAVYYSSNNGQNWIENYSFLNGNFYPYKLCASNGLLFTGSNYHGVWKRSIAEIIGIQSISSEIPGVFSLYQNYPNPFNPVTKIKFSIPTPLAFGEGPGVRLVIYDILGREIAVLVNEQLKPGTYEVEWNASNYPSGVYFYKLTTDASSSQANPLSITKKMVLLK